MQAASKKVKLSKRRRPNYKKETPAREKSGQSRKSGKGTSLMHAAAKPQSKKSAADANQSPEYPGRMKVGEHNRADFELRRLQKSNPQ